jgi:molybdenum storage protein
MGPPKVIEQQELIMSHDFVVGDGRVHLDNKLMGESLIKTGLQQSTDIEEEVGLVPRCKVIGVGGRSIMDRGRAAVLPIVDALVEVRKEHDILIGVSGGARLRHVYHVALDLGIPTGGIAQLAGASEEQNVAMLQQLMARHNAVMLKRDHFADLPLYLQNKMIPIVITVPPYHYWEPVPKAGRLPENGSDLGLFMTAEAIGSSVCVFIKDVDGLYTDDPATNPEAALIERISADELIERNLPSLVLDRTVIETLRNTRFVKEIQIINGLHPERLAAALAGKHVGTIIYQER